MSYIADAHRDWHTVNGWNGCPWDCYESEARAEEAYLASLTRREVAVYYGELAEDATDAEWQALEAELDRQAAEYEARKAAEAEQAAREADPWHSEYVAF